MSRETEIWRAVAIVQTITVALLAVIAISGAARLTAAATKARDLDARNAELAAEIKTAVGHAQACVREQQQMVEAALDLSRRCHWRAASWDSVHAR